MTKSGQPPKSFTTETRSSRRCAENTFWVQPGKDFCSWGRRYPVHHDDAKTRRNPLRFFASSRLRGEIFLVAAGLHRVHLCSSAVSISRILKSNRPILKRRIATEAASPCQRYARSARAF